MTAEWSGGMPGDSLGGRQPNVEAELSALLDLIEDVRAGWRERGACRTSPIPVDVWHGEDPKPCLPTCAGCPVRADCMRFGADQDAGVWGGYNTETLKKIRSSQSRAWLVLTGETAFVASNLPCADRPGVPASTGTLRAHNRAGTALCDGCKAFKRDAAFASRVGINNGKGSNVAA